MELAFDHRKAAHCENGVTSNLLRYYGYDYSEPLLFGLSASLYFVHLPFVRLNGLPATSFRPMPGQIFGRATRLLGFRTGSTFFLNKNRGMQRLNELLEENKPVGAVVSVYFLPYAPNEYRFHFNAHNLCVIGRDSDEYIVSDPIAIEKVRITCRDLQRARFARGTLPPMGRLYWIREKPRIEPDLAHLIPTSIRKNVRRMIYEPGPMPLVGVNGLDYLAKRIPSYPERYGVRGAALHLAQLVRMLEEIGTGGAGFRFIYAAFLQEGAAITGNERLNEFSERLTGIGDAWRQFATLAARVCKHRSVDNVDYKVLGGLIGAIGQAERQFFQDLEKAL